jgi:uncharacterized protein (DUF1501 family)
MRAVDRPSAGLLTDLRERGLLDDTLVIWGGKFGRTPHAQNADGRDHNNKGFTLWLAGGGVKRGFAYGATDELGYEAGENAIHIHDLHATILHLLGLDHERLTFAMLAAICGSPTSNETSTKRSSPEALRRRRVAPPRMLAAAEQVWRRRTAARW